MIPENRTDVFREAMETASSIRSWEGLTHDQRAELIARYIRSKIAPPEQKDARKDA